MNISKYISDKISEVQSGSFTSSVTKIAIISIAAGIAIMIVSFAILEGFRNEIREKIFSFGAHLQVSKYDTNNSYEGAPISVNIGVTDSIAGIKQIQPFARKTAIIKTEEEVLGVVLKGIGQDYDLTAMQQNLEAGELIAFNDSAASKEVLISQTIADKLKLEVGDEAIFYFIQNPPRARKLEVKGIFNTGLEEFDEVFVLGDIQLIQELNNWPDTLVGGIEIVLKDFNQIDQAADQVFEQMNYDLQLEKITDRHAQLFDWLKLLRKNVIIFLVLIIFVASFNMVSTVFIMIIERINMIGVLKAVGATDAQIRQVFYFRGLKLTIKGLIWGNIIGLGFCALQYYFELIPLDPENYYMDRVPISWNFGIIVLLNVITLLLTMLAILIPAAMVARIKPVKAIKFD
ncbi:lipoprotein-releasing system permease protein [Pontibacter ummariensis]|uniref:Lipoprotein-releasing system permease protein n=1 Tax=Pontibacter ummariensis TaxID=1610492 RepID=A0A239EX46_9BACT|nr:FtsX-like permease family protein [Pontibacter ummariensis]PRY12702.1 lipoprotein-releasing system permease protein [Pontibacter ummariensis]SNS49236.1 lipoprotein-releasing system permease protein [Pontibacter ummariensis]